MQDPSDPINKHLFGLQNKNASCVFVPVISGSAGLFILRAKKLSGKVKFRRSADGVLTGQLGH